MCWSSGRRSRAMIEPAGGIMCQVVSLQSLCRRAHNKTPLSFHRVGSLLQQSAPTRKPTRPPLTKYRTDITKTAKTLLQHYTVVHASLPPSLVDGCKRGRCPRIPQTWPISMNPCPLWKSLLIKLNDVCCQSYIYFINSINAISQLHFHTYNTNITTAGYSKYSNIS